MNRMRQWLAGMIVIAMCSASASGAVASASPGAATQGCSDVLVLGARGSGQPAAGSSTDGSTGMGPQVYRLYQRIGFLKRETNVYRYNFPH